MASPSPPSFDAKDNELRWSAEVGVEIEGWPDWTDDVPVAVVASPRLGEGAEPDADRDR